MIRPLLIITVALIMSSCDNARRDLVLVRPDSLVDEEIAEDLVELFDAESPLTITLSDDAMPGGDALSALLDGRADIALVSNNQPFHDDIATIIPMYATVLHIVRFNDSDASSMEELLQGAMIYAGQPGSASRQLFERWASAIDLGDDGYEFVNDPKTDVDLAVVFAPITPERIAELPDARLWSIGDPEDIDHGGAIDSAVLLNPHFRPFVIPAGTYGDATPAPVVTIAVDKLIVGRDDLDGSVVYDLIDEILRLRPALGTIHPGLFQELSEDFDVSRSRFVVHPGTQDYLQRSEPTFVERYSGVAEVLVTLFVAAVSAAYAGIKVLNRRRKNRIDRFYKAAIDIRNAGLASSDSGERQKAMRNLQQLQDEAFAQLVDEKLAADESFRIFITLTNDIAQQLDVH